MKKIIYQWFVPALFSALVLASCDKYLDVQPKGIQLLTTATDYDQWLNSFDLANSIPWEINLLADNIDNPTIHTPLTNVDDRAYSWQSQFSDDITATPLIWVDHYKSIYYFNTVLQGIDDATGTEQEKKSLKAEALLGRALEYLYLVNLYGKPYNANTADQDLAVPFVTSNDLNTPTPARSTVQQIYDHIIMDVTAAIPDLPEDNSENRFRGSVAAAYSVLARTYLYMGDYSKAAQNAQLALDNGPNTMLDYSTMANSMDIPELLRRTGAIYARFNITHDQSVISTLAFLQSFDPTDLRLKLYYTYLGSFYTNLGDYSSLTRGDIQYKPDGVPFGDAHANWGTSVAEMRLILAEVAARSNDLSGACNELDLVRKCRFLTDTYVKFESDDQEEVLQKVLQERNLEFPYCGMRWFDMRRLDAKGRMSAVNRYDAEGNVIATLSPGSAKYTLQIPIQVLYFNPDWPQNPTDE